MEKGRRNKKKKRSRRSLGQISDGLRAYFEEFILQDHISVEKTLTGRNGCFFLGFDLTIINVLHAENFIKRSVPNSNTRNTCSYCPVYFLSLFVILSYTKIF